LDFACVGQGIIKEALGAVIQHAFEVLRLHRIMANYVPTNQRSARVLARQGFSIEGYARAYLFIDGAWQDHVLTSLTNHQLLAPADSGR
jgi:ribosomal-protein-alanine N-acetyltransferase